MAMVGHKTQAIYSRYAIADEGMLRESAEKLASLHTLDLSHKTAGRVVQLPQSPRATS